MFIHDIFTVHYIFTYSLLPVPLLENEWSSPPFSQQSLVDNIVTQAHYSEAD